VHVFAKALAEVNTMNPDVLRPAVLGSEFDAPQGRITIDPDSTTAATPTCGRGSVAQTNSASSTCSRSRFDR
jgi:branched-chain amino acid transport system substrate-binding protein